MGVLNIKKLLVRSHLGFDPHASSHTQDLMINISISYNSFLEEESDNPADAFDIVQLTNEIIGRAENSHFNLIEAFTRMVLNTVLEFDKVESAKVEVKKLQAIQFSGELSFVLEGSNR
ncbi:FolB domain-containing protein [Labilibacter sediminis]|nr:FolB domain-containing protein [Labilibacter sediminis]